jgi:hypothetical protein
MFIEYQTGRYVKKSDISRIINEGKEVKSQGGVLHQWTFFTTGGRVFPIQSDCETRFFEELRMTGLLRRKRPMDEDPRCRGKGYNPPPTEKLVRPKPTAPAPILNPAFPSMHYCSNNHDPVCFGDMKCPVCREQQMLCEAQEYIDFMDLKEDFKDYLCK